MDTIQNDRYTMMIETPIHKLIPKLAVPTIISMLVSSIYNMADTYFVSQISTSASGAVGIIFSLMAMIQTVGFTLGMGSGNTISRLLGMQKTQEAHQIASVGFFTSLVCGALFCIVGLVFLEPLVYLLGSTDTIAPYAMGYAKYILMAAPFMCASFVMNNLLRAQGNAFYAMIGITTGGILNMILDPLFIFVFDMGIEGAAIATGISQLISFGILFYQSNYQSKTIPLKLSNYRFSLDYYAKIISAGFPSFCRQGMASIASVLLNTSATPFGDPTIAAMSIVTRFMMFINSSLIGFGQGFQPVCGFNYGSKRYDRVIESFWFCVKVAVVALTIFGVISFIFAKPILTLFRKDDLEVIAIGTTFLKLQAIMLPFQSWIIMVNMLTQSIGYSFRASIVALGRQGIFLIPLLFTLPNKYGLIGLQLSQPLADAGCFILATVIVWSVLKDLKHKNELEKKQMN